VRLAPTSSLAVAAALVFVACSPAAPAPSPPPARAARSGGDASEGNGRPAPLEKPHLAGESSAAAGNGEPVASLAKASPEEAPATPAPEATSRPIACNEQAPQSFLMRSNHIPRIGASPEEADQRQRLHMVALEYRIRRYGFIRGVGSPTWNPYPPVTYTEQTTFFGIKVRLNKRIIPALACVEEEIRRSCAKAAYKPEVLDGIRFKNTLYNGEVTNHAFGIAIDINPGENSCCGCLPPLDSWPTCKRPAASPFERTKIPKCWVDSFTKYGFYWLGYDPIGDTMHFEFLGDPDAILKSTASP